MQTATPWLTERHGYGPTCVEGVPGTAEPGHAPEPASPGRSAGRSAAGCGGTARLWTTREAWPPASGGMGPGREPQLAAAFDPLPDVLEEDDVDEDVDDEPEPSLLEELLEPLFDDEPDRLSVR